MKTTLVWLCCLQLLHITHGYERRALQSSAGTAVSCPKGWQCSISDHEYNLKHLNTMAQFHIRTDLFQDGLKVKCKDIQLKDLQTILPSLRIAEYATVRILECPSSASFTVGHSLRTLGVAKCNTLYFDTQYPNQYFGELPELDKLSVTILTNAKIGRIPEDLFSDKSLGGLTHLEFYSNVMEIPVNLFGNLENLNELKISKNLQALPSGIFRNKEKLQDLWLSGNKLRNLTKDVFNGAESLITLGLANNAIEYLAGDIFEKLTHIQRIDLSDNRLKSLPVDLFKQNKNLVSVKIDGNHQVDIPSLPSALLANLNNLTEVSFECGLASVTGTLLANSSAITNVYIRNNEQLTTLPAELFTSQVNLLVMVLRNNSLKHLPDSIFKFNVLMTHLVLSANQLESISRLTFENLERLEYVDLSDNRLHSDGAQFYLPFRNITWLADIRLSHNRLREIPSDWISPQSLRDLDLSNNDISTLNTRHLEHLINSKIEINLRNNQIRRILLHDIERLEEPEHTETLIDLNDNPIECDCELLTILLYINGEHINKLQSHVMFKIDRLRCVQPPHLMGKYVNRLEPNDLKCPIALRHCPAECSCHNRTYDDTLIVDCSQQRLNTVPNLAMIEAMNFTAVELNVENNQLGALPLNTAPGYGRVTKLLLASNNLSTIEVEQLPKNVSHLDLRRNHVPMLSLDVVQFMNKSKVFTTLLFSHNPWLCECSEDSLSLLMAMKGLNHIVDDFFNITCSNTDPLKYYYELQDLCYPVNWKAIGLFCLALVVSLVAVYYKYEKNIKIWLYARNLCLCWVAEHELDKDKTYDAFISYSHRDEDFVVYHLQPELEDGIPPFRLCVHERDFMVGACIPDQIVNAIENSRRTIVVLSENFVASRWSRLEFKLAHEASLTEGRNRVIVIIYGDIGDPEMLDDDLKAYLKMKTYLKWGDPWFWEKLRFAMPHTVSPLRGQSEDDNLTTSSDL